MHGRSGGVPVVSTVHTFGYEVTMGKLPLVTTGIGIGVLDDGLVHVGSVVLDVDEARAVLARLEAAVGEIDRAEEGNAWVRLDRWLDRHFAGAVPATASDLRTRRSARGLLRRESVDRAVIRLTPYTIAYLLARPSWWEGPVLRYYPDALGGHTVRATPRRVRVASDAVLGAPWVDPFVGRLPSVAPVPPPAAGLSPLRRPPSPPVKPPGLRVAGSPLTPREASGLSGTAGLPAEPGLRQQL